MSIFSANEVSSACYMYSFLTVHINSNTGSFGDTVRVLQKSYYMPQRPIRMTEFIIWCAFGWCYSFIWSAYTNISMCNQNWREKMTVTCIIVNNFQIGYKEYSLKQNLHSSFISGVGFYSEFFTYSKLLRISNCSFRVGKRSKAKAAHIFLQYCTWQFYNAISFDTHLCSVMLLI